MGPPRDGASEETSQTPGTKNDAGGSVGAMMGTQDLDGATRNNPNKDHDLARARGTPPNNSQIRTKGPPEQDNGRRERLHGQNGGRGQQQNDPGYRPTRRPIKTNQPGSGNTQDHHH